MEYPKIGSNRGKGYVQENVYSSDACNIRLEIIDTLTPEDARELSTWLLDAAKKAAKIRGQRRRQQTIHERRMKTDSKYQKRMWAALD
jgi:hypothetical protein